jgi:hypothetical protein
MLVYSMAASLCRAKVLKVNVNLTQSTVHGGVNIYRLLLWFWQFLPGLDVQENQSKYSTVVILRWILEKSLVFLANQCIILMDQLHLNAEKVMQFYELDF